MSSYRTLEVRPLTLRIGAEIGGVDLASDVSQDQIADLKRALGAHQVLFFRDQALDCDSLKRFGRAFGELAIHSGVAGLAEHPEVVAIHADATSKYVAGEGWHSDLTCDAIPPMGSILYLHTVPETGGDTIFSSMSAAWEALSDRMQAHLGGLVAEHDGDHVYRPLFPDLDKRYPCSNHPVVRTHPWTEKKGLFVNASYTTRILDIPKTESEALLAFLFDHVANPNFHVRFRWRPGSVAFWDNRCTQHLAVWDYFPQTRSGIRVTVAGEKPI
ncbi:MAG: TauD/TfdA dioxygenase family protein [Caulobacteraceae bacterium]